MKNSIKRVQRENSLSALLSARILRKAKLRLTLLAAIPLLMGLTSCQQEEDFAALEQEIRVAFTTDAIKTRVNTLEGGDVWENGDELYFCRISGDNEWAEYSLTATVADEVTTWTPNNKLYWDDNGEHQLVVSYPVTGYVWDTWYVPEDQSTLPNLKRADHMNAMWKGTPTTETINFNLKHRLSMVTVTYTLASEFEPTADITPEVYSNTQYILFDVNTLARKDIAWNEGDDIWVKAYKHEEVDAEGNVVAKKFTAIVSPDAYSAGDDFIRVTIGGQVLTAKMKEAITFAEGTHYTFDLKVGKDKVTIEKATIGNDIPGWDNDSEEDLN